MLTFWDEQERQNGLAPGGSSFAPTMPPSGSQQIFGTQQTAAKPMGVPPAQQGSGSERFRPANDWLGYEQHEVSGPGEQELPSPQGGNPVNGAEPWIPLGGQDVAPEHGLVMDAGAREMVRGGSWSAGRMGLGWNRPYKPDALAAIGGAMSSAVAVPNGPATGGFNAGRFGEDDLPYWRAGGDFHGLVNWTK
jgi:hypothetical protein